MAKKKDELVINSEQLITSLEFLALALSVFKEEEIITESQVDNCIKSICLYIATSKDVKITKKKIFKTETKTNKNGKAIKNGRK